MKIYVKNMVCDRCKLVAAAELRALGFDPVSITLGEIELDRTPLKTDLQIIDTRLRKFGFELIDNKKKRIIEKIKNTIIHIIHHSGEQRSQKYSELITEALHYDYPYLSKLFSEVEGITIEHYLIGQKIEKVKELIVYDELSLSEIADQLGYSSVAHLSAQFKKITGSAAKSFKNIGHMQRRSLDDVGKK